MHETDSTTRWFVGFTGLRRHPSEHLDAIREELGDEAADRVHPGRPGPRWADPQEIALSILAGVVAAWHDRRGGWLA